MTVKLPVWDRRSRRLLDASIRWACVAGWLAFLLLAYIWSPLPLAKGEYSPVLCIAWALGALAMGAILLVALAEWGSYGEFRLRADIVRFQHFLRGTLRSDTSVAALVLLVVVGRAALGAVRQEDPATAMLDAESGLGVCLVAAAMLELTRKLLSRVEAKPRADQALNMGLVGIAGAIDDSSLTLRDAELLMGVAPDWPDYVRAAASEARYKSTPRGTLPGRDQKPDRRLAFCEGGVVRLRRGWPAKKNELLAAQLTYCLCRLPADERALLCDSVAETGRAILSRMPERRRWYEDDGCGWMDAARVSWAEIERDSGLGLRLAEATAVAVALRLEREGECRHETVALAFDHITIQTLRGDLSSGRPVFDAYNRSVGADAPEEAGT